MITLHKATEGVRNIAKWTMITLGIILVISITFRLGGTVKELIFPRPKAPPTVEFGKLPRIEFPENATNKSLTYSLNTLSGTLPVFPDRIEVYKISPPEPNLLAQKRIQERVSKVGFRQTGIPLSETRYQWDESSPPFRKLVFDILLSNFSLASSYLNQEDIIKGINLPNEAEAKKLAQNFLEEIESYPSDIDSDKTKTTLYEIKNSSQIPTASLSSAQVIRVDFFQKNINEIPIYYPHPPYSIMNLSVSGGKSRDQIVAGDFFHENISTSSATTYPIKTAQDAFEELKKGNAYIASYNTNETSISIKNVFLGYYVGDKKQDYILPIIIFEGANNFFAYIPAIKNDWVN